MYDMLFLLLRQLLYSHKLHAAIPDSRVSLHCPALVSFSPISISQSSSLPAKFWPAGAKISFISNTIQISVISCTFQLYSHDRRHHSKAHLNSKAQSLDLDSLDLVPFEFELASERCFENAL